MGNLTGWISITSLAARVVVKDARISMSVRDPRKVCFLRPVREYWDLSTEFSILPDPMRKGNRTCDVALPILTAKEMDQASLACTET